MMKKGEFYFLDKYLFSPPYILCPFKLILIRYSTFVPVLFLQFWEKLAGGPVNTIAVVLFLAKN